MSKVLVVKKEEVAVASKETEELLVVIVKEKAIADEQEKSVSGMHAKRALWTCFVLLKRDLCTSKEPMLPKHTMDAPSVTQLRPTDMGVTQPRKTCAS